MNDVINLIHNVFSEMPILPLSIALAGGHAIGDIPFGKFKLGGVTGSLIAGILISLFGVKIDDTTKNFLFSLFIFAIGYSSGPRFFRSLGRNTLREVMLAFLMAAVSLITILAVVKAFGFDKGLAIGITSGALTDSAILGVASGAIDKMGLAPDLLEQYNQNISAGYAVTYAFGTIGPIIVCAVIIPKFLGKSLRDGAVEESLRLTRTEALGADENFVLNTLIGRVFRVEKGKFNSVAEIEAAGGELPVTVEKVMRGNAQLHISPELRLLPGDTLLLVGRREAVIQLGSRIGAEVAEVSDMNMIMKVQEVILTNAEIAGLPVKELHGKMKNQIRHGVYVMSISRKDKEIKLGGDGILAIGDTLMLYGSAEDVRKAVHTLGVPIIPSIKTDLLLIGLGIATGFLIGMITVKIGGVPFTLSSGGGILLSGLFFGWLKSKRPQLGGTIPSASSELLKDFGLSGFIAIVGLNSGLSAISTIQQNGLMILAGGFFVTLAPLLVCMVIGRYMLKYKNPALFAGALAGASNSNPAFGQVISLAGNSAPTIPYAVSYGLGNILLTLLGSVIAAIT